MATLYTKHNILNALFRGQALKASASVFLGLLTASPTGSSNDEVSLDSSPMYKRIEVPPTGWTEPNDNGEISNSKEIAFTRIGTVKMQTIKAFGIFDAPTGGNLILAERITPNRNMDGNDVLYFDIGRIVIGID